jgi:hypothetical protein
MTCTITFWCLWWVAASAGTVSVPCVYHCMTTLRGIYHLAAVPSAFHMDMGCTAFCVITFHYLRSFWRQRYGARGLTRNLELKSWPMLRVRYVFFARSLLMWTHWTEASGWSAWQLRPAEYQVKAVSVNWAWIVTLSDVEPCGEILSGPERSEIHAMRTVSFYCRIVVFK